MGHFNEKENSSKIVTKEKTQTKEEKTSTTTKVHTNNLLYKEYKMGFSMGEEVVRFDNVTLKNTFPDATKIVVFFNDKVLKTICIEDKEIKIELGEWGNYGFYACDEEENLFDISKYMLTEGKKVDENGVIPLI